MDTKIRLAKHAGSWYPGDQNNLNYDISYYLSQVKQDVKDIKCVKALISPHAGYNYSGQTAAWSYQYLKPSENQVVFLLGPSHSGLFGCGLSKQLWYDTPLGKIPLNQEIITELRICSDKMFFYLTKEEEEQEHSLELQLPFIKRQLDKNFTLVPITVGQIDYLYLYGKILAKYFNRSNSVFIISTDFCHWGYNFGYQLYDYTKFDKIWQFIEHLDREAMTCIEQHSPEKFEQYMNRTKNTICGYHAIDLLLYTIANSVYADQLKTKFLHYTQSNKVTSENHSSVSYAAAISYLPN